MVHRDDATRFFGADDEVCGESSQRRFVEVSKEPDYNFEFYNVLVRRARKTRATIFLRLIIPFGLPFVMEERFARQFSAVDWRRVHHSLCFCSLCCQSEAKSCLWQLKHFCWRSLAGSLRWNSWSLLLSVWLTMSDALSRMTSCSYDMEGHAKKYVERC